MRRLSAILLAVWVAGCGWGTTDLEEIAEDPFRFQARSVTVRGEVVWSGALPRVGRNGIEIAQDGARLLVLTTRSSPPVGTVLKLSGQIEAEFDLGDRRAPVLLDEAPDPERTRGVTDVR